jgi:hypothetical protein
MVVPPWNTSVCGLEFGKAGKSEKVKGAIPPEGASWDQEKSEGQKLCLWVCVGVFL